MRPRPAPTVTPAEHSVLKGFPMTNLRSFFSTYSPILALSAVILSLYAMAMCIGFGLIRL